MRNNSCLHSDVSHQKIKLRQYHHQKMSLYCLVTRSDNAEDVGAGTYCYLHDFPAGNCRNLRFIDHLLIIVRIGKQHAVLIKTANDAFPA